MTRSRKHASRMNQSARCEALEGRALLSATPHVMGYLPDYEFAATPLNGLDWNALTQINYFSVQPNAATGAMPTVSSGIDWNTGKNYSLSQLTSVVTAAKNHSITGHTVDVDIVIGGAGLDDSLTSIIDGSQTLQNNFATAVQTFCTNYRLSGVDLDWEPANPTAAQITNYGNLIHTLRTNTAGLQLSAAVNAEKVWLAPSYDSTQYLLNPSAVRDLDTINVMAYDLGNPGDGAAYQTAETDMTNWGKYAQSCRTNTTTQNFLPKLIMGVPFYGSATTIPAADIDPNDPWSGVTDDNTSEASYAAILAKAPAGSVTFATTSPNNLSQTLSIPHTLNELDSTATWHFDGRGTVYNKTTFALNSGFGGVMAWELGQDYFSNGAYDSSKSLLPAIQTAVNTYVAAHPTTPAAPTPAKFAGTIIGSSVTNNSTRAKAFDGSLATTFHGSSANGNWLGLDFGSTRKLTQIKFAAAASDPWEMEGGVFQASNTADFSSGVVTLYTVPNTAAPSSSSLTSVNVNAAGNYRYVRYLAPAGSYGDVAELQFFGTPATTTPAASINLVTGTTIQNPSTFNSASEIVDSAIKA